MQRAKCAVSLSRLPLGRQHPRPSRSRYRSISPHAPTLSLGAAQQLRAFMLRFGSAVGTSAPAKRTGKPSAEHRGADSDADAAEFS